MDAPTPPVMASPPDVARTCLPSAQVPAFFPSFLPAVGLGRTCRRGICLCPRRPLHVPSLLPSGLRMIEMGWHGICLDLLPLLQLHFSQFNHQTHLATAFVPSRVFLTLALRRATQLSARHTTLPLNSLWKISRGRSLAIQLLSPPRRHRRTLKQHTFSIQPIFRSPI